MSVYSIMIIIMCIGNSWSVVVSGPEAAVTLLRAEGKYPSRGYFEENMMWIYRNINKPYPMFFRYVAMCLHGRPTLSEIHYCITGWPVM